MSTHVIVWDLETVPDLAAAARILGFDEHCEAEVKEALGDKFAKLPLHKIVCIGAVVAERLDGVWSVQAIGAPHIGERSERELIISFADKVSEYRPQLVTFNGNGFDLPVLRYRAMMHRISAPGLDCRPYFKRYTEDCLDLCDVLSSFESRSRMKLHDLSRALGLPGKPDGMDGSEVERYVQEGRIAEVAAYCETDVVNTFRIWLLHELFRGTLSQDDHQQSELALDAFIRARTWIKPHWEQMLGTLPSRPAQLVMKLEVRTAGER